MLRVLGALAGHADTDAECFPGLRTLALECGGVTLGAVRRDLAKLRALGYVERINDGGPRTTATYRLSWTPAPSSARRAARADDALWTANNRSASARRAARAARARERAEQTNEQNEKDAGARALTIRHRYPCSCDECVAGLEALTVTSQ
jgi:hypothetical protein